MSKPTIRISVVLLLVAVSVSSCSSCGPTTTSSTSGAPSQGSAMSQTVTIQPQDTNGQLFPAQPRQEGADEEDARPVPVGNSYNPVPAQPQTPIPQAPVQQSAQLGTGAQLLSQRRSIAPTDPLGFADLTNFGSAEQMWETSVAAAYNVVWETGNLAAAYSTDYGHSFTGVDPTTLFPLADGGYCGDQLAEFVPQGNWIVWTYLTCPVNGANNRLRLAVAHPSDIAASGGKAFHLTYDLTPELFGLKNSWLDYPTIGLGANYLYITFNVSGAPPYGGVIARIAYRALGGTSSVGWYYSKDASRGYFHVAQNMGDTAYWVAPDDDSHVWVYSWNEQTGQLYWVLVHIGTTAFSGYSAPTPDGRNWVGGLNWGAPGKSWTGVTLTPANRSTGPALWIAHTAGTDTLPDGHSSPYPHPWIYVVRLQLLGPQNMYVTNQQSIWNPDYAFGYPSLATNANGEVGVAFGWGGYSRYADPGVGILTDTAEFVDLAASSTGPDNDRWGDYTTIRMDYPYTNLFAATGYITTQTTDPIYAVFGRSSDLPGD